jgi:hypothetical protein
VKAGTSRALRVVVIAAAVMALPLSGAEAAKKKKPAKLQVGTFATSVVGSPNVATGTATCPGKTRAVAGGYTTSAPSMAAGNPHWLNVYESQKIGQREWRVSGAEHFPAPATDSLIVYVYCEAMKAKVKTASSTVALPTTDGLGATALASCPKGTKSISGGFSSPPFDGVNESYVSRSIAANATGWVVDATNVSGASARTFKAIAYCADVRKMKGRTASAAILGPQNSARTATTPKCQKGLSLRGGGFATSTPVGGLLATALVYETKVAGGSWSSSAAASGDTTKSTLVTNAYCR